MKRFFPIIGKLGTWIFQALEIFACVALLAVSVRAADEDPERDPDLIAGRAAMQDGFYAVAQQKFQAYLDAAFFQKSKAKAAVCLAQALLGQGKAAEASKFLSEHWGWRKDTPSEGAFAYWLARSQFDQALADDALKTLRDFETKFAGDPLAPAAVRLRAHAYLKAGRREKAVETFDAFQKSFPRDAEAPANLLDWAGVLMEDLLYHDAEQLLQQLTREYPDSVAAARGSLWLGQLLTERGADVQARMIYGALLAQTNIEADIASRGWLAAAAIDERGSNFAAVVSALQRGEALATNASVQVESRLRRAHALQMLGRNDEASKLLAETLRLYPSQPRSGEALLAQGDVHMAAQEFQSAVIFYQRYLESVTDTNGQARAMLGKANALWSLQRYAEAADACEKAAARQTDAAARENMTVRMADALYLAGQYKSAHDAYQKIARDFPASVKRPQLAMQSAEALAKLGEIADAEQELREIEKKFSGTETAELALLRRAQLQQDAGNWKAAGQVYGEFETSFPNSPRRLEALLARANVRYRTGDFLAAISDCDLVLKDSPDSSLAERAFFLRARCFELKGDAAKAVELGQQFLLKYSGSALAADVAFWLGEQAFNRRDFASAEKLFADLAKDFPTNQLADDACYWAGRAAAAADDYKRAVTFYNQVAKLYTNSPLQAEARFAQGDALSEIGEYAAAILAFDEVVRLVPAMPLADMARGRKGDCQFTLAADKPERYREALASFRSVMDSIAADADLKLQAEYKLGRCLEKMGKRAESFDHYLSVVYRWQSQRQLGQYPDAVWFTRAAFAAAAMKEEEKQIAEAIRIYERVVAAGLPAGEDARQRITKLKAAGTGG